jgi:hypothetical protein
MSGYEHAENVKMSDRLPASVELQEAQDAVYGEIKSLQERLLPILRPESPVADVGRDPAGETLLYVAAGKARAQAALLRDIIQRVDL